MHDYLLSVFLGVVEGLTEFLPVSSTAHLRITEKLFSLPLDDPFWKMYSIVIQLGAILCLPIYFRARIGRVLDSVPSGIIGVLVVLFWLPFCVFCLPEWLAAFKRVISPSRSNNDSGSAIMHPLTFVIIAFVCTAVPSLLLTKLIGKHLESLTVMGTSLLVGGVIMWIVDAYFGSPRTVGRHMTERMEDVSLTQAVWIGICQVASAVFPGTSRSMSTIAAGQVAGMSRTAALEFSFFLSMPTMVAATGYDLFKTFHPKHGAEALGRMPMDGHEWTVLLIGFVVSFIVALAVVAWFMNWVRQRGFTPFAIYRIVVGIAVLVWVMRG
ncbi:MAG TPA: undecaprenyl-diphosphate phosphatase [Candidatus Angelobacter sp.]|nr:undecaprenyl-diphosphate phosphatase [Candidatus Angelobacter sp.]